MDQKYKVGDVVTGKVTGIQPYGAFVALDDETQGLVHISEITYGYVKDVHEFIKVGEEINVKILDIDEEQKKISLSIRVLQETPVSKKREVAPRKTLQERDKEDDKDGFKILQEKLGSWIKQKRKKKNMLISLKLNESFQYKLISMFFIFVYSFFASGTVNFVY